MIDLAAALVSYSIWAASVSGRPLVDRRCPMIFDSRGRWCGVFRPLSTVPRRFPRILTSARTDACVTLVLESSIALVDRQSKVHGFRG